MYTLEFLRRAPHEIDTRAPRKQVPSKFYNGNSIQSIPMILGYDLVLILCISLINVQPDLTIDSNKGLK